MSAVIDKVNPRNEYLNEPIFDLGPSQEEPLDEKKVQFSIYNEIKPEKNKTKQDEKLSLQMTCTQEWFIRCSWTNKLLFIEALCRSTNGCFVLENILQSIELILSKDVLESLLNESSNYIYDKIPLDDNRALESEELNCIMQQDVFRFLCLDPSSQVQIILKLLRIGGGGLIFSVFKLVEQIYRERKAILKPSIELSISTIKSEAKSKQKLKSSVKSQTSKQTFDSKSFDRESSTLNNYAYAKMKQLQRRDEELLKYKKLKGIFVEDSKPLKKGETKETIDYLQILPIWLNRKIMSYIDDKTLSGFKKVGKYWGKMIDESINEKSGRKAINAKINKIAGIKADKAEQKNENKKESEKFEFIIELGGKDLIMKRNENEKNLIALMDLHEAIFSKKCEIKNLDTSFYSERYLVYDSTALILASTTPSNTVHFFSARTGSRLQFLVFGLESPITCLALHENRTHIFLGCKNGTLLSKDIRTNKTTASFNGHTKTVLSIFTTSSNLLSASLDNTIKYFQLWSGLCLLCVDLNPDFNISSALLSKDKLPLTLIGTVEGFLILVDIQTKKFLAKVKLHCDEIKHLVLDREMLITGSKNGEIRIWNANNFEDSFPVLKPYFNIDAGIPVSCLKLYKNQIFLGCKNGTLKIVSLATGKIFKTVKISSQSPIMGLDITEDKLFMKLIIWHEEGIEIRSFSLQKSSSKKMSIEKDNRQSKQKAPKQMKKNKAPEIVLSGYIGNSQGFTDAAPVVYRRTTFGGKNNLVDVRCCTLSDLRKQQENSKEFNASVFTKAYSNLENTCSLITFPRIKTKTSN